MAKQQGTVTEGAEDNKATYERSDAESTPMSRSVVPATDMLTYMADMLMELRSIAEQNKWQTLSGLLALSHAEANTRRDDIALRRVASGGER